MKRFLAAAIAGSMLLLSGCGSAPEPAETKAPPVAPAPAKVPDHTSLFPKAGQTNMSVIPDHMLDMKKMPGGSFAEYYEVKGKKYQMFIIDAEEAQKAAFLLLDMKAELRDPAYIAEMGGFFGMYGDKPLYCFAKLHYLAGVVGLPQAKADPMMRDLAAQLH
jgi:hypothetical protein